jgi:hypothetical protein
MYRLMRRPRPRPLLLGWCALDISIPRLLESLESLTHLVSLQNRPEQSPHNVPLDRSCRHQQNCSEECEGLTTDVGVWCQDTIPSYESAIDVQSRRTKLPLERGDLTFSGSFAYTFTMCSSKTSGSIWEILDFGIMNFSVALKLCKDDGSFIQQANR